MNIMSDWFVEGANHTCGDFPPEENEMELSGLTPMPSDKVKPPRIAESAVHMECKLKQVIELEDDDGKVTTDVVIGRVVMFHISEGVYSKSPSGNHCVDSAKLLPISRLGGLDYGRVTEMFHLDRPSVPKKE